MADWANTRPLVRTWRSSATTPQAINFAFGAARNGTWMALLNCNFTLLGIGVSTNGTVFTDIMTGSTTFTSRSIGRDVTDPNGYRKYFLATTYNGKTHGRLEIPAQATTDGAPYFQIGLAAWGTNLTQLSRHFQVPVQEDYIDPEYKVEGKDWEESFPAGIPYKTLTFRNRFPNGEADEWHELRLLRPGSRLLGYMNLGNNSQTDLWVKNRPVSITRQGKHQEIDAGLRTLS